jgi:hypothetical protein
MPLLIMVVGQWLLRVLPSLMGFIAKVPVTVVAVALAASTFVAGKVAADAALGGLHTAISASPKSWCLATAFGVDLGLYWFVQGMTVSVGIVVFLTIKQPAMAAAAELAKAAT